MSDTYISVGLLIISLVILVPIVFFLIFRVVGADDEILKMWLHFRYSNTLWLSSFGNVWLCFDVRDYRGWHPKLTFVAADGEKDMIEIELLCSDFTKISKDEIPVEVLLRAMPEFLERLKDV